MIRELALLALSFLCFINMGVSQDDPVLFTVDKVPVNISEFNYIYNKNNGENADYSKASLEEYLDLYTKFKLKVAKARSMGLDTVPRLQQELAGYRKQLASSYLVDKEVSEKLVDEVVERMQTDVKISHIFISDPPNAGPKKNANAKERVSTIHTKLKQGADFADLAKQLSDDKRSGMKGGLLGYYVAMLPEGFYEFENAMYNTPVGEFAAPVRSKLGYHIITVHDRRPARAEMEVSHILINKKKNEIPVKNAKGIIDSLYKELKNGQDFGKLASLYSQDKNTSNKAGYLGFFKINQYETNFEEAAHALKEDGAFSEPIETKLGYHIIKRHSLKDNTDEGKMRRKVQAGISKDDRFDIAKKGLIMKIKEEAGVKENQIAVAKFVESLTEEFYSYKWELPADLKDDDILNIGESLRYGVIEFANYCKADTRTRLRFNKKAPLSESVNTIYEKFVDSKVLGYEESNLANKYPEFKALMREYEEGILLFEATKMEVWDKASKDTVGLKAFHERNLDNYKWDERIVVDMYAVKGADEKTMKSIQKKMKKLEGEALAKAFNTPDNAMIKVSEKTIEKSSDDASNFKWKVNSVSQPVLEKDVYSFYKVKEILPGQRKTMKEARGYIIADYQDELEQSWIKELKDTYKIKVDQKVFDSLIKK